jgi:hypothetical protein
MLPVTVGVAGAQRVDPSAARSAATSSTVAAPAAAGHSPRNSGTRLENAAVIPSVRSFDGRNAAFHAAT